MNKEVARKEGKGKDVPMFK